MPPEIRSRIWDFVFADLVVRINHGGKYQYYRGAFQKPTDGYSIGHQQISCYTSRACEEQWRQRHSEARISVQGRPNPYSEWTACELMKPHFIPVHLLQVCRQIYHEAVLRPFTEPTFRFIMSGDGVNRGVTSFLKSLVPVQATAIRHLFLNCCGTFGFTKIAAALLKGVQHVEIDNPTQISKMDLPDPEIRQLSDLELFNQKGGVVWLKKAGLKSLRFTIIITHGDAPDQEHRDSIIEWIEREKNEIVPAAASKKRKRE